MKIGDQVRQVSRIEMMGGLTGRKPSSGNAGKGVLDYHGDTYPFRVGGLGVSKIEVYGLEQLRDFPGAQPDLLFATTLKATVAAI